jgi:hypothetical protein
MPKRKHHDPERATRDARDRVFRRLRGLIENHWSMAASYATAEKRDVELGRRLLNSRATILELIDSALPTPALGPLLEESKAADQLQSKAIH